MLKSKKKINLSKNKNNKKSVLNYLLSINMTINVKYKKKQINSVGLKLSPCLTLSVILNFCPLTWFVVCLSVISF